MARSTSRSQHQRQSQDHKGGYEAGSPILPRIRILAKSFEDLSEELALETVRHKTIVEQSSSSLGKLIKCTAMQNQKLRADLEEQIRIRDQLDQEIRISGVQPSLKGNIRAHNARWSSKA